MNMIRDENEFESLMKEVKNESEEETMVATK